MYLALFLLTAIVCLENMKKKNPIIFLVIVFTFFSHGFAASRVSFSEQYIDVKPSRADLSFGSIVLTIMCIKKNPIQNATSFTKCDGFKINGLEVLDSLHYIRVQKDEPSGKFFLASQNIEYSPNGGAYLTISLNPRLNEIPNKVNSSYYSVSNDRYTILTYRTVNGTPSWGFDNVRFTHNLVRTLGEFKDALSRPLEV